MVEYLPVATQTLWADLNERAWTGNLEALTAGSGGSAYAREVKGRRYWYWRAPTEHGERPAPRYIGPESEQVLARIDRLKDEVESRRDRRDMVRALRAARLPVPDPRTGDVLAALAEAGAFRLRATLIGSVAFQCYAGLLGVRLPASLSRTGDVNIAQFHSIALAVEDSIEENLESLLKRVDRRFRAVLDPFESGRTLRYVLEVSGQETYSLDILSPLRGPERGRLTRLRALRSDAHLMRFLDYLLYQEQNAVVLHGAGVPVNVPAPERYALHKLIVAQLRQASAGSQAKAGKDLEQAQALIAILAETRPDDLRDAWSELRARGPSWRQKADRSLRRLSPDLQVALTGP
ncbi:nucleotidyltransferase family protein [Fodinicurvata fenggangensis]|uniref:nucleotidyltransferase family protein n=1 Tax=Fodinicurvata fenggangensis TaxID=1121830 RepID=UPI00054F3B98|nr:GSU2403 family nucleotidyltransferase fold protein [Fodinicurvata fenggangensis]